MTPRILHGLFPLLRLPSFPFLPEKFWCILETPCLGVPHGQCDTQGWHGVLELGNLAACSDSSTHWLADFGRVTLSLWTSGTCWGKNTSVRVDYS